MWNGKSLLMWIMLLGVVESAESADFRPLRLTISCAPNAFAEGRPGYVPAYKRPGAQPCVENADFAGPFRINAVARIQSAAGDVAGLELQVDKDAVSEVRGFFARNLDREVIFQVDGRQIWAAFTRAAPTDGWITLYMGRDDAFRVYKALYVLKEDRDKPLGE